jgi:hypothetical protein
MSGISRKYNRHRPGPDLWRRGCRAGAAGLLVVERGADSGFRDLLVDSVRETRRSRYSKVKRTFPWTRYDSNLVPAFGQLFADRDCDKRQSTARPTIHAHTGVREGARSRSKTAISSETR